MKRSRKAALTALLFSVAMNMNGCVYGPPPDDDAIEARREEPSSAYSDGESPSAPEETSPTESEKAENKI